MSIEVNIAVQKNRVSVAQELIDSLNKQTIKPDLITLILQGFKQEFKSRIELNYVYNDTNKGSAERLKHVGDGVNLIIDDDFIASNQYVETALKGLERNPNALCSFWGYRFLNDKDYFKSWANLESWKTFETDIKCSMLGVGLSFWDESILRLKEVQFDCNNYIDTQLAVHCLYNKIEQFKIAHPADIARHIADLNIQANALWRGQMDNKVFLQSQHEKLIKLI
jgi:hypothetical protein